LVSRKADVLDHEEVLMGDLILVEVLQGIRDERTFRDVRQRLTQLEFRDLGGRQAANAAAENYRLLRSKGITIRKTINMIIGTYCILHARPLLHADKDFDALETYLGLTVYRG